jgi:hypothetical protein
MQRIDMWPRIARQLAPKLRCSFCRRSADEVERLVSGARAYICDACVTECVAVLEKNGGFGRPN